MKKLLTAENGRSEQIVFTESFSQYIHCLGTLAIPNTLSLTVQCVGTFSIPNTLSLTVHCVRTLAIPNTSSLIKKIHPSSYEYTNYKKNNIHANIHAIRKDALLEKFVLLQDMFNKNIIFCCVLFTLKIFLTVL